MQCALVIIYTIYYLLPTSFNKLNLLPVDTQPQKNASSIFFLLPQKTKFSSTFSVMETSTLLPSNSADSANTATQQTPVTKPITYNFATLRPTDRLDEGDQLAVDDCEPQHNPTNEPTNPALVQLETDLDPDSAGTGDFDIGELDNDIKELVKATQARRARANERGSLNQKNNGAKRSQTVRVMKQTCIEFTSSPRIPLPPAPPKTPTIQLTSPTLDLKNNLVGHIVAVPGKQSSKKSVIVEAGDLFYQIDFSAFSASDLDCLERRQLYIPVLFKAGDPALFKAARALPSTTSRRPPTFHLGKVETHGSSSMLAKLHSCPGSSCTL